MTTTTNSLGQLVKVDLREVWETEDGDFTPWLAKEENISILGDAIGIELDVEAQEKNVGPFRADILCKDTTNSNSNDQWVLIENQLERTNHGHLGQLLTYAAGLNAVTIVWIADRFTDEHRAAMDWLNEITNEDFNFFGLEVELWRIGESPVAPKFNIVSKPNDWTRSISGAVHRLNEGELTETKKLQLEYWTDFHKLLSAQGTVIRGTKPRPQNWNYFSIGSSKFGLITFVNTRDKRIGVGLICRPDDAKSHFFLLSEQKAAIEAEVGSSLDWRELPDKKESRIKIRQLNTDPMLRSQWPEQHQWLSEELVAFHKTLCNRIKHLDASDYEAPGEGE
jgi:hypothetical protein